MADPEQTKDEPVSKPGVASNVPVQNGSDEVYDRPKPKGRNTILLVSLVLLVVVVIFVSRYLF